jgi:hypothetical protein
MDKDIHDFFDYRGTPNDKGPYKTLAIANPS